MKYLAVFFGVIIGLLILVGVSLRIFMEQAFASPTLAVVSAPTEIDNEIWFLEFGFVDRIFSLYVKSPCINDGVPERLKWGDIDWISKLSWSIDGNIALFSRFFPDEEGGEMFVLGYDFSRNVAVMPKWQHQNATSSVKMEEWKQFETTLIKLVEDHGGFSDSAFTRADVEKQARKIWYWNIPKG